MPAITCFIIDQLKIAPIYEVHYVKFQNILNNSMITISNIYHFSVLGTFQTVSISCFEAFN